MNMLIKIDEQNVEDEFFFLIKKEKENGHVNFLFFVE
jgi:hypothetical protein